MSFQKNEFQIIEQEGIVKIDYQKELEETLKAQISNQENKYNPSNIKKKSQENRMLSFSCSGDFVCLGLEQGFELYETQMFFKPNLKLDDIIYYSLQRTQNCNKKFNQKNFKKMLRALNINNWSIANIFAGHDKKIALQFNQKKNEVFIWDEKKQSLFTSVQFNQDVKKLAYPKKNILIMLSNQYRLIVYDLEKNQIILLRERVEDFSFSVKNQNQTENQIYILAYTSLEDEITFSQKLFYYNFVLNQEFQIDFQQNKDLKQMDYSFYSISQQFAKFQNIQLSQDGNFIAVVSEHGQRIAILSTQNQGQLTALLKRGNSVKTVTDIQFSPDNFALAVVSYDKSDQSASETLHVFDISGTHSKSQELHSKFQYDFNMYKEQAKKMNLYFQSSLYNLLGPKIIFNNSDPNQNFTGHFSLALISETDFFFLAEGNLFQDPKEFPKKQNMDVYTSCLSWILQENYLVI